MTISTITFSEFISGGDLKNSDTTVGIYNGQNAKFNNPWTFLTPGTTAQRPEPSAEMYYRLRFNTTDQLYEYYDQVTSTWVILDDSGSIDQVLEMLASNSTGEGASLIGLEDQTGVTSKTVQDFANASLVAQTDNGTLVNGFFLSALPTGFMAVTTTTGALSSVNLSGTANQISVTNGTGTGNPVFSLPSSVILPGTLMLGGSVDVNNWGFTNSQTNGGFAFTTNGSGLWELNSTQGVTGISNDPTMADDSSELIPTQAAVKAYAATIASGFTPVAGGACVCSTTANLNATYTNGAAGVGAELEMNAVGVFTADGVTPTLNQRILVSFQTDDTQNGIYTITTLGDGSTQAVLTRATDYDTPAEITPGSSVAVKQPPSGTNTYGGSLWIQTDTVTTIGTDSIQFQIIAQPTNTFVTLATSQQIVGAKTFSNGTLLLKGSTSGTTTLQSSSVAGSSVITFPPTVDTAVTNSYLATLTNKTMDFNNNTILNIPAASLANNTPGALISWTGLGAVTTINPGTVGLPLLSSGSGNLSTYSQLPIASISDATEGSIFVWDDNGNATAVPPGTSGYAWVSNGPGVAPSYQQVGIPDNIVCESIEFNPTTSGIIGTTTNDSASTGIVGEYISASTTSLIISAGTPTTISSISLTAGDWDVSGIVVNNTGNINNAFISGISLVNNAFGSFETFSSIVITNNGNNNILGNMQMPTPVVRISIAATTTVYLVGQVNNGGGSPTLSGFIRARRVR